MAFEVFRTTAEHVVAAIDAALQCQNDVTPQIVSDFIDIPIDLATNALQMATELGFLRLNNNIYNIISQISGYLVTSSPNNKAAIMRFMLEQYLPYKTFKFRLSLSNGNVRQAATETRALHQIQSHRDIIETTLTNLGTYANSLTSQGAGLYVANEGDHTNFLTILDQVIQNNETAAIAVRRRLGESAYEWIDNITIFNNLVISYQRAAVAENDPRAPIVHAGNAIESFLVQVANILTLSLTGATGINSKVDRLAANINPKHQHMLKYLGHLRNAADHGVDTRINAQWGVNSNTSIEYVHIAISTIRAIVSSLNGIWEV